MQAMAQKPGCLSSHVDAVGIFSCGVHAKSEGGDAQRMQKSCRRKKLGRDEIELGKKQRAHLGKRW